MRRKIMIKKLVKEREEGLRRTSRGLEGNKREANEESTP
jgi:hypothetical protein